jgi:hypothetical protein
MRIIGTIPHPDFRITVFAMDDKYLVQFEAGPMIQSYRISKEKANSLDDLKKFLDADFMESVRACFNQMFTGLKTSLSKTV